MHKTQDDPLAHGTILQVRVLQRPRLRPCIQMFTRWNMENPCPISVFYESTEYGNNLACFLIFACAKTVCYCVNQILSSSGGQPICGPFCVSLHFSLGYQLLQVFLDHLAFPITEERSGVGELSIYRGAMHNLAESLFVFQ